MDAAVKDVAVFRAVTWEDLAVRQFGGNKFAAARGVARMEARGWVTVEQVPGSHGWEGRVVVATAAGAKRAESVMAAAGDRRQVAHFGAVKIRELAHDAAVYRAAMNESDRINKAGGTVRQIRIDAELKGTLARRAERARREGGAAAALEQRLVAATLLELPVNPAGHVMIPDAQIEYVDAAGRTGRCNVEVATEHYSGETIRAKVAAGFVVVGATARAIARVVAASGSKGKRGRSAGRDEGLIEL